MPADTHLDREHTRGWVNIRSFGAKGDGVSDDTKAIEDALAASDIILVPDGRHMARAGIVATGKKIVGTSPFVSKIKLLGSNTPGSIFVNDQTDPSNPGAWGSGRDVHLENIALEGNWDGVSGLAGGIGVQQADYGNANSGLVKVVSSARVVLKNCWFSGAYEHGLFIFRSGYSEVAGNRIFSNRGSGLWLTADAAGTANTSTTYLANRIEGNKGYYGNLRAKFTYGVAFVGNLLEAGNYNWYLEEGKNCAFVGNYAEAGVVSDAFIDPAVWGYTFVEHWNVIPSLPPMASSRGIIVFNGDTGLVLQTMFGSSRFALLQAYLSQVGGGNFARAATLRMEGSGVNGSDGSAAELQLQANAWAGNQSRFAFRTNDGAALADRAYVDDGLTLAAPLRPATDAKAVQTGAVYMGSGVPNNANGNNGDVYHRTDTPAVANQRIYVKSAGAWVGIV